MWKNTNHDSNSSSCSENLLNGKLKIHIPFYKKNFKHKKIRRFYTSIDLLITIYFAYVIDKLIYVFGYDIKLLEIYQFLIWMLLDDYTLDLYDHGSTRKLVLLYFFIDIDVIIFVLILKMKHWHFHSGRIWTILCKLIHNEDIVNKVQYSGCG